MRIASWNVNSIRSRLDQLTAWLARSAPDVVCMQETKVEDALFPHEALAEVGYRAVNFGSKAYNGVAIAAKLGLAIDDVKKNFDDDPEDAPRRLIAATVEGVRIVNVYVPNGQQVGSDAFTYKLEWFQRLGRDVAAHHTPDQELVICGDFNVAPEEIDVYDPPRWEGGILFHPAERASLKKLMGWGLVDVFRKLHPGEPALYSWWDYRMSGFRKNRGLRIDLALCTEKLAARCVGATIDTRPRGLTRPSDHAPLVIELLPVSRVLYDGFSVIMPAGWSDAIDETSYSEASQLPRQRFAPAFGRGEMTVGRVVTRRDEMPGADTHELEELARAWGVHRGVAVPLECRSVTRRDGVLTTASFELGRDFVQLWYLANGAALIEVTYVCPWSARDTDRAGRDELVASLRFA